MEIDKFVRENIRLLQPYSCARDEYDGKGAIFLDANENPYATAYNRYPDPYQCELKLAIAGLKGVAAENIVLGNGSDEIIDLLIRSMCEPRMDNIIVFLPGYSMYEVSAAINNVDVRSLNLTADFLPDWPQMWSQVDAYTKMILLCTPNNPTGRAIPLSQIEAVCRRFEGLVLVDEAYIDFTTEPSALTLLECYSNVVVVQTLSKAWGMAGLRVGMCFAARSVIEVLNKVKPPYNISSLTQTMALALLRRQDDFLIKVARIKAERERLAKELPALKLFDAVYPSEANFILVTYSNSRELYRYLIDWHIVVRLRDIPLLIAGGIRITIGTKGENDCLLEALKAFQRRGINE